MVNQFNIFEFETQYTEELIFLRSVARESKNWAFSDEIRNYLDTKLIFIFDTKFGQEIYQITESYINRLFNYSEKRIEKEEDDEVTVTIELAWSETRINKIQRLHNIKFDTIRKFVEWNIQNEIKADKGFDSWLYSTQCSTK